MALDNLRAFIGAIETQDDLVRVDRPVAVDKEITEIADRCMKSPGGGPALLFQQPTLLAGGRSRYPVAVDRKSTRLNSSHDQISYAVFCLKKKTNTSAVPFSI